MLWGSSKPGTVRGGAVIPVLILGQELLPVQQFAVRGTCVKDCWAVKAREGSPYCF